MEKDVLLQVDDRCFLRVLNTDDVSEDYVVWLNDYEVTKYTEQKYFDHDFKSVKEFVLNKYESDSDFLFGIFFKEIHIGNIKIGPIKWEHKSTDISYFIGNREFWGKGIATRAIKIVVDYATDVLGLEKITAGYYEPNIGSAKALERCGFRIEGKRESELIFEGERIDHILVGYVANKSPAASDDKR